jgi:hypothetical protein
VVMEDVFVVHWVEQERLFVPVGCLCSSRHGREEVQLMNEGPANDRRNPTLHAPIR